MEPTATDLDRIREIYRQGLYRQAWDAATAIGDPAAWTGKDARIFAGRLFHNIGNRRRANAHHIRAWRENRDDPVAAYYMSRVLFDRRGPLEAWRFLLSFGVPDDAPAGVRSDLLAGHATAAGMLRDFSRADRFMAQAAEADPTNPWVPLERGWLLEMEDRYEEALAASRESLELQPGYRPGIQAVGRTLILLGRDREALDLLTEGAERLESGHLVQQLVDLLVELGQFGEAKRWLDRLPELWPDPDQEHRERLAGLQSDVAYLLHDVEGAIEKSRGVDHHFFRRIRENLKAAEPDAKRVLLYVPFIRQHHMTCSAATLASLADFWSVSIDHETVADEIVYAGARPLDERRWGESHGFRVAEFTLTWDATTALVDRGIPFTLTTSELSSSHLQAVVGYDARRGTLLIRDPFIPSLREFLFKETMERYGPVGPRCMILVPEARADLLAGIPLPDRDLYDAHFEIAQALETQDRDRAREIVGRITAENPDHRLTIEAELDLAGYDQDSPARLALFDRLLTRFPDSEHWNYRRLSPLWELGRRMEHLETLARLSEEGRGHSAFLEQYAQALLEDGGRPEAGLAVIRKAIRRTRTSAASYYILGRILWALRHPEDALEAHRFATCLDDKEEHFASRWFTVARQRGETESALAMLADRVERFGDKSSAPARTLAGSLHELDRVPEKFEVIEDALRRRPDDGNLLLYAAWEYSRHGDLERGRTLLERGRGLVPEPHWLRNAADIANFAGDLHGALELLRQSVTQKPLAMPDQREFANRLAAVEGHEAVRAHFDALSERFPHHVELAEIRNEWLATADPARAEAAAREFVSTHPGHPRAHRDLASVLTDQGRFDEALEVLEAARKLDPTSTGLHNLRGQALAFAGRTEEATEALREGVRLSVDNTWGIRKLVNMQADSPAEAREARFVRDELKRQVTDGTGLNAWRTEARNLIDPEEVLAFLREVAERRPDLRSVPGDIVRQLRDMGRLDEAWNDVTAATERFPLVPDLWTLRAEIAHLRGDSEAEIDSLDRAVASRPSWTGPLRLLADAWERAGDFERSCEVSEIAVARDPANAHNHGYLADALRRLDRKDEAIESLRRAVELNPEYEWAWNLLDELSRDTGDATLAVEMARELAEKRSGEAENWIRLSRMMGEDAPPEERLAALLRAEALEPANPDVHDHRAVILAEQHRYEEAAAACRPEVYGESLPLILRGRAVWVTAERGRPEEAMAEMEKLLAVNESYTWGWHRLFSWAEDLEDQERLALAAENLVRLDPNDAVALARVGDVREEAEELEAAYEHFDRSSTLEPSYRYAGYRAVKLALQLDRVADARVALERIRPFMEDYEVAAFEADCAAAEGDGNAARAAFARTVESEDGDAWSVGEAMEAVESAGGKKDVDAVFGEALESGRIGGAGAGQMVMRLTEQKRWPAARAAVKKLADRDGVYELAAEAYLRAAGRSERAATIAGFLDEHGDRLREVPKLWGLAQWTLACTGLYRRGVEWSAGWQEREGVEGWMLENVAHCLRAELEDRAAAAVSLHALSHARDHTASQHEIWLAFDAILRGDAEEARGRLGRVDERGIDAVHRVPLGFTGALLDLDRDGKGAAPAVRKAVDRVMADEPWARRNELASSQYERTVRAVWSRAKGPATFLWMLRRLVKKPW